MIKQEIEIINRLGMHARAATKFASTAIKFDSDIGVEYDSKTIDGKSIMSLMLLAAAKGALITLSADGADEKDALLALTTLISNRFDEED